MSLLSALSKVFDDQKFEIDMLKREKASTKKTLKNLLETVEEARCEKSDEKIMNHLKFIDYKLTELIEE